LDKSNAAFLYALFIGVITVGFAMLSFTDLFLLARLIINVVVVILALILGGIFLMTFGVSYLQTKYDTLVIAIISWIIIVIALFVNFKKWRRPGQQPGAAVDPNV